MQKKYIILPIILSIFSLLFAGAPDTLWTKGYRNDDSYNYGRSVQQTIDGGFIIVGGTSSFGDTLGDVYLILLDTSTIGIQEDRPANYCKSNDFIVSYDHGNNLISIHYSIPYSSSVKLEAYDIKGKLIKVIIDKFMNKGSYTVNWDSRRCGSCIYYLKLTTGNNTIIRKAVIIK